MWNDCATSVRRLCHGCENIVSLLCDDIFLKDICLFLKDIYLFLKDILENLKDILEYLKDILKNLKRVFVLPEVNIIRSLCR